VGQQRGAHGTDRPARHPHPRGVGRGSRPGPAPPRRCGRPSPRRALAARCRRRGARARRLPDRRQRRHPRGNGSWRRAGRRCVRTAYPGERRGTVGPAGERCHRRHDPSRHRGRDRHRRRGGSRLAPGRAGPRPTRHVGGHRSRLPRNLPGGRAEAGRPRFRRGPHVVTAPRRARDRRGRARPSTVDRRGQRRATSGGRRSNRASHLPRRRDRVGSRARRGPGRCG
jgi:hypothetical protein